MEVPDLTIATWAENIAKTNWGAAILINSGIVSNKDEARALGPAGVKELMDRVRTIHALSQQVVPQLGSRSNYPSARRPPGEETSLLLALSRVLGL